MYLIGDVSPEERQHAEVCAACQTRIATLVASLASFRGAVREWSDRSSVKDRAAEMRWTVIPAADHLERLLLPASVDGPWFRSLWSNLRDFLPAGPRPVGYHVEAGSGARHLGPVRAAEEVLGDVVRAAIRRRVAAVHPGIDQSGAAEGGRDDHAAGAQHRAIRTEGGAGARQDGRRRWRWRPVPAAREQGPAAEGVAPAVHAAGGSCDQPGPEADHGAMPSSRHRMSVCRRSPWRSMAIRWRSSARRRTARARAAESVRDPAAASALVTGGGFGPGEGGGVGGGVYRVGGGVTAPVVIFKKDPEYSEEARKAKYQGTVLLTSRSARMGAPRTCA